MSFLEIVLAVCIVALGGALVVAVAMLGRARRRATQLASRVEQRRIVPKPADAVRTVVGTAIKVRDRGISGAIRSSIDELALWADVERPDLARLSSSDGSVTILFSDIENSTALNHQMGDRTWVRLLTKHDRVLNRAIKAHHGHVIKTQGDGFMVAFAEPAQAIAAAVDAQRGLSNARSNSLLSGVKVRIGIHRGEAIRRDGDLFGRNVAFAARIAAAANGGEVLISDAVRASIPDVPVQETRPCVLKGVPGVHEAHVVELAV